LALEAAEKNEVTGACGGLNEDRNNDLANKETLAAYTETPVVCFSHSRLGAFYSEIERLV